MCPPKPTPVSWQSSSHTLILAPGAIHLWQVCLEVDSCQLKALNQQLSVDEQARSTRFRNQNDQERYIVAHGSLRTILSRYLGTDPARLAFQHNAYGKPFLHPSCSEHIRFNMSRSGGLSLIAVAKEREVGVDIERIRHLNDSMQIAEQFFCPAECSFLGLLVPEERRQAFFRYWTLKEAFVKGRGQGLSIPLDRFEVGFQDERPILQGASGRDGVDTGDWSLLELNPHPGYAAALAVKGPMAPTSFWRLDHAEKIWGQDR